MKNLIIDLHILHTFPINNMDPNELGFPKLKVYGNVPRAMVSKEAWRYALGEELSDDFKEFLEESDLKLIDDCITFADSFSTHFVENEYEDQFVVDDISGDVYIIGPTGFNSSTQYRYISIDFGRLIAGIGEKAYDILYKLFCAVFYDAVPKKNIASYAHHTLPFATYVTVRKDHPLQFGEAFRFPVKKKSFEEDLETLSERRMLEYAKKRYVSSDETKPIFSYGGDHDDIIGEYTERVKGPKNLFAKVCEDVRKWISENNNE